MSCPKSASQTVVIFPFQYLPTTALTARVRAWEKAVPDGEPCRSGPCWMAFDRKPKEIESQAWASQTLNWWLQLSYSQSTKPSNPLFTFKVLFHSIFFGATVNEELSCAYDEGHQRLTRCRPHRPRRCKADSAFFATKHCKKRSIISVCCAENGTSWATDTVLPSGAQRTRETASGLGIIVSAVLRAVCSQPKLPHIVQR